MTETPQPNPSQEVEPKTDGIDNENNTQPKGTEHADSDPIGNAFDMEEPPQEEEGEGENGDILGEQPPNTTEPPKDDTEPLPTDMLADLIGWVDDFKASICQAIAGDETPNRYKQPQVKRNQYAATVDKYLATNGVKFSPTNIFLLATLMFFAPAFLASYNERTKKKRALDEQKKKLAAQQQEAQNNPTPNPSTSEPATDQTPQIPIFSNLQEFKTKRKRFDIYTTTGCYKFPPHTSDSTEFLGTDNATEQPSEYVKMLIAKKLDAATIRKILGYE